jgi:trk system potassium uptake protein TrkA
MAKQALVIGLGQFGMSLSRALSRAGCDVLAVDQAQDRVQTASAFVSQAICIDATDEPSLSRLAPERRDFCICAIGDEAREASIIVTALLRQMGARHIVARCTDDLMDRILRLVGAHAIVNPERAFGERLATRLIYDGILEEMPLGDGLIITELRIPPSMIGRTLIELELPRRFSVTVVALRREQAGTRPRVLLPDPRAPLLAGDILVVVSEPGAAQYMADRT